MFQRIRRSAIGFAVVMAAFTVYRVAAVPFLEPSVPPRAQSGEYFAGGAQSAGDPVLTRLFPPNSWLLQDPIKLENDHSQLLMREYRNLPDGRVEMNPCAILFFPGDADMSDAQQSQGRIIVLEAPEGATAQFDQPLDLQSGKVGHLLGAHFHGPVTIRGTPSRPGATDDIAIVTRDVQMDTDRIWTHEPVDFRFGQNTGHGRDLQILLLPSTHAGDHGPSIGGIQTIELLRDVQMRLVSGGGSMMPMDARHPTTKPPAAPASANGAKTAADRPPSMQSLPIRRSDLPTPVPDMAGIEHQQPAAARSARVPAGPAKTMAEQNPPVDIRCKGKFRFDMVKYLATFDDQVDVTRTPHDGPSDQMTCEQLIVHFAARDPVAKPSGVAPVQKAGDAAANPASTPSSAAHTPSPAGAGPSQDQSGSTNQKIPNLQPERIEARGNPVIVRAPSNGSYASGEHLDYDIPTGQVTLDGGDQVTMQQQTNEIHARSVVYQPGEPGRLGRLLAIGPGWLRGVPPQSSDKPQSPKQFGGVAGQRNPVPPGVPQQPPQLFEAHWSRQLKLRPYEQNHVISLLGDARAGFTGQGELSADEIHLWLLEPPPADKAHPAPAASAGKSQIQPDRMLAIGQVQINSTQLIGSCSRLEAWFQQATPPQAAPPNIPNSAIGGAAPSQKFPSRPIGNVSNGTADNRDAVPNGNLAAGGGAGPIYPANTFAPADRSPRAAPAQNGFMPMFAGPARGAQVRPSKYEVDGQRIRVQMLMRGDSTTVEDLAVDGQVHLVEVLTPMPGDEPLRISGDALQVVRASDPDTDVTISGRPAQAASRGMEMEGDVIRLDKGANRLWIDGPGRMKLPANQLMNGDGGGLAGLQPTAPRTSPPATQTGVSRIPGPQPPAQPLFIDWQGRMAFDGLLARFERSVVCQTDTRNLRTELLDVTMRERVNFAQPQSGQRTDVGRIFCHGDVLIESRGFDVQHALTNVERLRAHDLTVDQVTGAIDGQGPGWLTSTRRGAQDLAPGSTPSRLPAGRPNQPMVEPIIRPTSQSGVLPAVAIAPQQSGNRPGQPGQQRGAPDPNGLTYLNVQFQGPITGNLNNHEIAFHDQVRTIYGPVPDWADQLNFDKVQDLGPKDELLNCDQMTLRQGAIVQQPGQPERRPMEMESVGNVSVEGATFRALANRMTYAEAKDLLVLEGDGRNDAELYRQDRVGSPPTRIAARRILYWRTANQVSVNDARYFDLDQSTSATAPPSMTGAKSAPPQSQSGSKKPTPPVNGTP
ncbi:MAG TPA: hypothetical protein VHX65_18745 [Pirellulales bacterium]|jgi:lipopolysaccharide export system protein LptA|nr:hypothetical protein [Pirellulales bacterium]